MEKVAHGVDEYHLRQLPPQGQLQHMFLNRQPETVGIVRLPHSLQAERKTLGVAMVAAGANLRAAGYRIPS